MQRNWKQPFLSVTYSELIGRGVWHLFIHIPRLYIHELPKKYAPEQNFRLTKDSREKISDPQNIHENKIRTLEGTMARWNETHKTHDSTKPTEFSTLLYLPQVKRALTLSITNIRYKLPHKLPNLNLEFKTAWSK